MLIRRALVALAVTSTLSSCRRHHAPAKLTETSFQLPNGLQVELVSGPCGDAATVVVQYALGADDDPPGRSGLVGVLARSLSNADRPVEAGADYLRSSTEVRRDGLAAAIDAEAARMAKLTLAPADLERGRAAALAEISQRHGGDAALTALSYAAESVQPSRGDGWRGGIAAEVAAITPAELDGFWQAYAKPPNARLIVVGRFDAAAVRTQIEAAFATLPAGTPPVLRPPTEATVTGTLVMGDAPAVVGIAIPAPPPTDPRYPAFLILATRLAAEASAKVAYDPLTDAATVFVTGAIHAGQQPDDAASRLRSELGSLIARPLGPDDLAATKAKLQRFLGLHALEPAVCIADPRGLAIARARRAQLGVDDHLAAAVDATTPAQLAEAAALFDRKRTAAVIAGGAIR